jgi:hypothetical protein
MTPLLRNLDESCKRYQILGYIYGEYTGKSDIYGYIRRISSSYRISCQPYTLQKRLSEHVLWVYDCALPVLCLQIRCARRKWHCVACSKIWWRFFFLSVLCDATRRRCLRSCMCTTCCKTEFGAWAQGAQLCAPHTVPTAALQPLPSAVPTGALCLWPTACCASRCIPAPACHVMHSRICMG